MPKIQNDNCSLNQKERDDVVLAIIQAGGIFSTTPPTDIDKMKDFILKNHEQVKDFLNAYNDDSTIYNIPNILEFVSEIVAPAVLSLSKEGKLPTQENIKNSEKSQLPKPQFVNRTPAHESYQSYASLNMAKKAPTGHAK